ncbi:MAG: proline reductase-associated electron transfer protein PrdC [Aristaeellaceae bacterium]
MQDAMFHYPLRQHIGAASIPVVAAGDSVRRGALLARKPEGSLGANLFSSVSGVVRAVTDTGITVEAKGEQNAAFVPLQGSTPLERIEEAGLVGLGGAGFPTWAKVNMPFSAGGTVIVNAAECEPILCHNIAVIEENPARLMRGLHILMEVTHAAEGIIAIKGKHRAAIARLREVLPAAGVRIALLPDLYPMGEERAVIRETMGKLLSVNSLPMEANAVVVNAETVCRVQEAVDLRKPLIDKDITVAGKLAGNENLNQVFRDVPLGISVGVLFDRAGGLAPGWGEIIMGGPFTGKRTTLDAPVVKTTGGLIAAECFMKGPERLGLLVCACGADQARLEEIAASMGSQVVGCECCKQAREVRGTLKCENPGRCPGQVQKVMALKKAGAQAVLISNCTDCSNTVMACAPRLGLPVYHCTDGALRAVNHPLVRRIHTPASTPKE